jgi:hypothetical protein
LDATSNVLRAVRASADGASRARGLQSMDTVYIVVTDASGATLAKRFLEANRVVDWLTKVCGDGSRCDVYDDAPGGSSVPRRVLHRTRTGWGDGSVS